MEEQKPTAPVMDVTPPASTPEAPESVEATEPATPAPAEAATPEAMPAAEAAPSVTAEAPAPASSENVEAAAPEAPAPTTPLAINTAPGPVKHKAPVGVIVAAIVIGLLLAGLAVFVYLKANKSTSNAPLKQAATTAAKVTASEVQDTANGVDQAISSVNDAVDLNSSDLSDTTLGL